MKWAPAIIVAYKYAVAACIGGVIQAFLEKESVNHNSNLYFGEKGEGSDYILCLYLFHFSAPK
ncbi:MAG: hypothetical protein GX550_01215 [Syntrophomonadaceae bacterium]|nr:hypothetical protein [Syntrophomonadaceae bacterium]